MPDRLPELSVPRLAATDRLVELAPFHLTDARSGKPPRLSTAVRVGLRGDTLCVRFDGRDDGIVASLTERDGPLWQEDVFEVFLSPEDPPKLYYEFEVNPLGTLFGARVSSPDLARATMQVETAGDRAGYAARVTRGPGRWSASLRIPLAELCTGPVPAAWRANFFRIDRGEADEYSSWSPTQADPPDFHVPRRFGTLRLPI